MTAAMKLLLARPAVMTSDKVQYLRYVTQCWNRGYLVSGVGSRCE